MEFFLGSKIPKTRPGPQINFARSLNAAKNPSHQFIMLPRTTGNTLVWFLNFQRSRRGLAGDIHRTNSAVFSRFQPFLRHTDQIVIVSNAKNPSHQFIMLPRTFGNTLVWFLNFQISRGGSAGGIYRTSLAVFCHFQHFLRHTDQIVILNAAKNPSRQSIL